MQEREGEESADDCAEKSQQSVEDARGGFCGPVFEALDVFAEEEIECRDDAAGQQIILGDSEKVDFRESDQGPVAEEHGQDDVDAFREGGAGAWSCKNQANMIISMS